MKVLVIGNGAREHALVWKLAQSPRKPQLFAAPGNAGTALLATNLPINMEDVEGLLSAVLKHGVDLTVVGPEAPLAAGLVDRFQSQGLRVFGPTKAASRIEWSKSFAKGAMRAAGAPTAAFEVFEDYEAAAMYIRAHGAPVVIKADGLAAGKGVVVAQAINEAVHALDGMMLDKAFGESGSQVVIEDFLKGQEVSVFCFTDGTSVSPLVAACDYKRVGDGNQGPNTGGMGGYSPPPGWDDALEKRIRQTCIEPVVAQLAKDGAPFRGVLYGGLMLTAEGPHLIEFNARFGDPECQLILPRLENDLLDVIDAVIDGKVSDLKLSWLSTTTVGVVLASAGYPGTYEVGKVIHGFNSLPDGTLVFQAGTASNNGDTVTSGGRVLTAIGQAATIAEARRLAYEAASRISFEGATKRNDIAAFVG